MSTLGYSYIPWPMSGLGAEGETQAPSSPGGSSGGGGGGASVPWGDVASGVTDIGVAIAQGFASRGAPPPGYAPTTAPTTMNWTPVIIIGGVAVAAIVFFATRKKS